MWIDPWRMSGAWRNRLNEWLSEANPGGFIAAEPFDYDPETRRVSAEVLCGADGDGRPSCYGCDAIGGEPSCRRLVSFVVGVPPPRVAAWLERNNKEDEG